MSDHERWLAETWQMIEDCAHDLDPAHHVSLSTAGCKALFEERRAIRTAADAVLAECGARSMTRHPMAGVIPWGLLSKLHDALKGVAPETTQLPTPEGPMWVTKPQMREVARTLCPDITDAQFNAMWAEDRLAAYRREKGE